jgi:hypothetical protein
MLESRTIIGSDLKRLEEIILDDSLPYGVHRKFKRFFDGATAVIFDREGMYLVAKKGDADDYEIDFRSREYMQLALYFGASLQKLDSEKR